MKKWVCVFSLGFPLVLVFWRYPEKGFDWVWIHRSTLLLGGMLCLGAHNIWRKIGWDAAVAFLYFTGVGLIYSSTQVWPGEDPRIQQALHLSASLSLLFILGTAFFLGSRPSRKPFFSGPCIKALWGVAALLAVLSFFGTKYEVPVIHNPSTLGVFLAVIAVGAPIETGFGVALHSLLGTAVIWLGVTTPLIALTAGLFARCLWRPYNRFPWWVLSAPVSMGILTTFVGYPKLGDGNGRFPVWRLAMDWWMAQAPSVKLFGAGLGSTPVLVPLLQVDKLSQLMPQGGYLGADLFFMYLHNDWLQILFETGIVGGVLALTLYGGALYRTNGSREWRAMLVAYGAAMITGFPLHSPLLAYLGILLLGGALVEARRE